MYLKKYHDNVPQHISRILSRPPSRQGVKTNVTTIFSNTSRKCPQLTNSQAHIPTICHDKSPDKWTDNLSITTRSRDKYHNQPMYRQNKYHDTYIPTNVMTQTWRPSATINDTAKCHDKCHETMVTRRVSASTSADRALRPLSAPKGTWSRSGWYRRTSPRARPRGT